MALLDKREGEARPFLARGRKRKIISGHGQRGRQAHRDGYGVLEGKTDSSETESSPPSGDRRSRSEKGKGTYRSRGTRTAEARAFLLSEQSKRGVKRRSV